MKSLLAFGILATTFVVATSSGAPKTAAPNPSAAWSQQLQRARESVIAQKLNLTDEQKAQTKKLRAVLQITIKATRANEALAPEKRRELVAAAERTAREPWRALLTSEQQAKLADLTSHPRQLEAQVEQRARAMAIDRQLGLTAEQHARIREIQAQAAAQAQPIRADAALSSEQKRAKLREVFQGRSEQIQGVLDPAQKAKLTQIRRRLLAPLGAFGG